MFGSTDNLNEHLSYSINEWTSSDYYKKVQSFLNQKKIKNIIDVGSCSGGLYDVFSKNIPSLEKCILVEAMPRNYEFIFNRLNENRNISIINKALFYGPEYLNMGSVRTNVGGWSYQSQINTIEVETITLERLIDNHQSFFDNSVDFVKIDIEGAEYNIIEKSTLLKNIPFVEIEFHENDEYGLNYQHSTHLSDIWIPFTEKNLPNHTLVYGGKNERVIWPNGQEVFYDGSGFFVHNDILNKLN